MSAPCSATIVGGLTRTALVRREAIPTLARPAHVDGVPDDGWPAAYRAAAGRAASAWADDAKLDTLVEVPWGKVPGRFAIAGYIQEILAHGWDLAQATGQPTEGDPELALWALATAKRILPPDIRAAEDVPFGSRRGLPGRHPLHPASRLARPPPLSQQNPRRGQPARQAPRRDSPRPRGPARR